MGGGEVTYTVTWREGNRTRTRVFGTWEAVVEHVIRLGKTDAASVHIS